MRKRGVARPVFVRFGGRGLLSSFVNGHNLVVDGGLVGGRNWTVQQQSLKAMRQAFGL